MKKKNTITITFVLMLILSVVYILKFTDYVIQPKYIYSSSYNDEYCDKKDKVNVNSITSIELSKSDYISTYRNLRYCKNLTKVIIDSPKIKNVDFLYNLNSVTELVTRCKSEDWQGISGCSNLLSLTMYSSNFSEIRLLSEFTKLEELRIESDNTIQYDEFEKFSSLKVLVLATQNADLKEISKASNISSLDFHCLEDVTNIEYVSEMKNLKSIWFGACKIDDKMMQSLLRNKSIENINFINCNFQFDEEIFNNYLNEYLNNGVKVEYEGNKFI